MKYWILFVVFFVPGLLAGQGKAVMSFVMPTHDLGEFSEDDGPQSHPFVFTNTGKIPLLIYDVRTSCGCTTPSYSNVPVLPGGKGEITITFHPRGHPGKLDKRAIVKTNASPAEIALTITGQVTPGNPVKYPGYRYNIGNLKLKNVVCRFGKINPGTRREERMVVANSGRSPLSLSFRDVPVYLSLLLEPAVLQPGESGDIVIRYKPEWDIFPGEHSDRIRVFPSNAGILPLSDCTLTIISAVRGK